MEKYLVSSKVAQLLKEKNFNEFCDCCYTTFIGHNGEYIDFDTECELKSEGRENEIEYIPYAHLNYFNCCNSLKYMSESAACPDVYTAINWIVENYHVHILYDIDNVDGNECYQIVVKKSENGKIETLYKTVSKLSLIETLNFALQYVLENII